jgi:hypothetical protein
MTNTYTGIIALLADRVTNMTNEEDRDGVLPDVFREALIHHYTEDMTVSEVLDEAEMLGILQIYRRPGLDKW